LLCLKAQAGRQASKPYTEDMKTDWDYTNLASSYIDRVDYATSAVRRILMKVNLNPKICDIGAGVGHLTKLLAPSAVTIDAIEPNNNMRDIGMQQLINLRNVTWHEGIAEATTMHSDQYDLVTFGSSFNVCNQKLALKESSRILKTHGQFACMWNLRDLDDPLQIEIEQIIKTFIPEYSYGTRRQDQSKIINESKLFSYPESFQEKTIHKISSQQFINAWSSHATLARQSGDNFKLIIKDIAKVIRQLDLTELEIPYTTVVFMAEKL
jgi:ubiquinone/menaquinone biosynthesis C-methylase UbiE